MVDRSALIERQLRIAHELGDRDRVRELVRQSSLMPNEGSSWPQIAIGAVGVAALWLFLFALDGGLLS